MVFAVGVLPALAFPEDQTPDQLRADATKLVARAQDLKADGHGDEANKLVKQAEELQQAAGKLEKQHGLKRSDAREDSYPASGEVDELRTRAKELEAAGKTDEARMVKRRLKEIDQRAAPDRKPREQAPARAPREFRRNESRQEDQPDQRPEAGPDRREKREVIERRIVERDEEDRRSPQRGDSGARQRRMRHVVAAIENLRAAGLNEPAERLERAMERMRRQFRAENRGENISPAPGRPSPQRESGPGPGVVGPDRPGEPRGPMPPSGPAPRFQGPEPLERGPGRPPEGVRPQDQDPLHAQVSELQTEVRELRRTLRELRSAMEDRPRERR